MNKPASESTSTSAPANGPERAAAPPRWHDRPTCPICNSQGVEKKQKWFCRRCGQLIQTCCD